ncbi:MAG: fibronectin type III domain-containing protein [Prevotella sp.]
MKRTVFFVICIVMLASCASHKKTVSEQGKTSREKKEEHKKPIDDVEYSGTAWITNTSKPFTITKGLQNRHLSVWASHGRYFNLAKNRWEWQRPNLFCTNEDLFTQTIVVPYLIPMLERSGAIVFTPRERDWQKKEIIVDNDDAEKLPYYTEVNIGHEWRDAGIAGFAYTGRITSDSFNPFKLGSTRMVKTDEAGGSEVYYQPAISKEGTYAVYVSYPTHHKSITDAQYIVVHKGRKTEFRVNQQMGGGTWVYLGTFDFGKGCSSDNRIIVTNKSKHKGVVTTDAVRLGGGMGNIARNGSVSGLPRCLEGSRYYAQWAGAPDSVYLAKQGQDDYKEDIYARPFMTNWLAGGSCFVPKTTGLRVPIELALAVHSDAGISEDSSTPVGTLTICTTSTNNGMYDSGLSRTRSLDFANTLLDNVYRDISMTYGKWNRRELYDRNYAETRCPYVPSAIIETLSHQNFLDMKYGLDPNFRFIMARSIYKSILKYTSTNHGKPYVVAPLPPQDLCSYFISSDTLMLRWNMQKDITEPNSIPTSYVLYTSTDNSGYDNGIVVNGTACKLRLSPGVRYSFKVTAVNEGGESMETESVSAYYNPQGEKRLMIVNGFTRSAPPAVIEDAQKAGFDLYENPGVWQDKHVGLAGAQLCYDKSMAGKEGPDALGYCGGELEGMIIKGLDNDNVSTHAKSLVTSGKYSFATSSMTSIEKGLVNIDSYDAVDLILGMRQDKHTFSPVMIRKIKDYVLKGGGLFVSGANVCNNNLEPETLDFLRSVLHVIPQGTRCLGDDGTIMGMGTFFDIYTTLNEEHYAATSVDVISPISPAFTSLTDNKGNSLCVAFSGQSGNILVMGFPFECIKQESKRNAVMGGIMTFLLNNKASRRDN